MTDKRDQMFPDAAGTPGVRRIVMEFESFRDFIQQVSPLVAEEGMFVGSDFLAKGLPTAGETVDFEVRLTDDFRLLQGRGKVLWVRRADAGAGEAGAAIRFQDLDEPGRRLVSRLITNHVKDGGKAFSLDAPEAGDGAAAVEPEPLGSLEAGELFPDSADIAPAEPQELDSIDPRAEGPLPPNPLPGTDEGLDDLPLSAAESLAPESTGQPARPSDTDSGTADETLEMPRGVGGVDIDALASPDSEPPTEAAEPGPVISEDLAQVADELSGVHRVPPVEMPSDEDRVALAGAASASSGRSPWRMLILASLAGIVLGVAAWYFFSDRLLELIGRDGQAATTAAATSEGVPEPSPVAAGLEGVAEEASEEAGPETPPEPEDVGESAAEQGSSESTVDESDAGRAQPPAATAELAEDQPSSAVPETAQPGGAISAVEEITWRSTAEETVVTIRLDGEVGESSYEIVRIREGAPRELIKIFGVTRPFSPKDLEVGSAHLSRLRTGLHSDEIHIVADVTGPAAAVTLVRTDGNRLIITFS